MLLTFSARQYTCTRKRRFRSKASATKYGRYLASRRQFKKRNEKPQRLYPYHCPYCGMWHLSGQKGTNPYHRELIERK